MENKITENQIDKFEGEFQKRYFTPSIEDIRVGYELEMKATNGLWIPVAMCESLYYEGWGVPLKNIRVPYLTKEQIEAEGWQDAEIYGEGTLVYKKPVAEQSHYEVIFRGESQNPSKKIIIAFIWHLLDTGKRMERRLFDGECKDINTFRYITKLLGI